MPLAPGSYRVEPPKYYGTPRELWGFRYAAGSGGPKRRALRFLRGHEELLGLERIALRHVDTFPSLRATHVLFQQRYHGTPIHRGYVTVHIDPAGRIYLCKNAATPRKFLPGKLPFAIGEDAARRTAVAHLGQSIADHRQATVHKRWVHVGHELRPAYRVRVLNHQELEEWLVFVDARSREIIRQYDNLALARGRAWVFDPNPAVARNASAGLLRMVRNEAATGAPSDAMVDLLWELSVDRRLEDLDGSGFLDGPRVTTARTANRQVRADHDYRLEAHDPGFEEVMSYYHLDRAIAHIEDLGYTGRLAIFDDALPVDATASTGDEAWYSPENGSLNFGLGGVNCAEDGETILHEFGHALQDAICRDFGQSHEAAAMGEGFGDYLAASFFARRKTAATRYLNTVMSWDAIEYGGNPPALRRVDGTRGYESFVDETDHEHDNGEIWSAALWEIWHALGRRRADTIIIESHFQQNAFTTLARGARAILDANENVYGGWRQSTLRRIFRGRGIREIE